MGMYTEFHFNVELPKNTPKDIIDILQYMMGDIEKKPHLPDDAFFECERWELLFSCDSYYFAADTHSTLRYDDIGDCWYLCVRSNLKNYDNEIEKFVSWIAPYLESLVYEFLGFYRYEETNRPTLLYMVDSHTIAEVHPVLDIPELFG